MRFHKISLALLVLSGSMLMAACGGGDASAPAAVANAVPPITISKNNPAAAAAVVSAVVDKKLNFLSGVPALGTTTPTSLTLTSSGNTAAPAFNVASADGSANGAMTFGSCIFTITNSTYVATSALANGKTITVTPCAITLDTAGHSADGNASPTEVTMTLGTTTSSPVTVLVAISPNGDVIVNGIKVATATVVKATGAAQ